jgi:hypothetical protein
MILTGEAFLLLWLLIQVFAMSLAHAILTVAIVFILAGLVLGERPWGNNYAL